MPERSGTVRSVFVFRNTLIARYVLSGSTCKFEPEVIHMTEEEALQRLRAQDTAVLHWLIGQYNRYVASIIRAVRGTTCREEDAEELTADVFYSVFRRAGSISPGKLQAYLGAAARNRAKDFLRKQKPLEADLDELTLPDEEGTAPEAELLRRERQMRVKEAIFSMEPVDREIFLRYYYYLQSTPEIAEAMRLTPGAVRTRLSRGRAALKKRLSQEELLCE